MMTIHFILFIDYITLAPKAIHDSEFPEMVSSALNSDDELDRQRKNRVYLNRSCQFCSHGQKLINLSFVHLTHFLRKGPIFYETDPFYEMDPFFTVSFYEMGPFEDMGPFEEMGPFYIFRPTGNKSLKAQLTDDAKKVLRTFQKNRSHLELLCEPGP